MESEWQNLDFGNDGAASSSTEKKRVRLALLENYKPFNDEMDKLSATLKSYEVGPDPMMFKQFVEDWQVELEFEPKSIFSNVVTFEAAMEYRETLSQHAVFPATKIDPTQDPPIGLFWDKKYPQPVLCAGGSPPEFGDRNYAMIPFGTSLNEAIRLLKAAGFKNQKGYLSNTDREGLSEAIQVLKWHIEEKMSIPDMVRKRYSNLDPETFKSKSTRYSSLLKQMVEIIDPPDHLIQQK